MCVVCVVCVCVMCVCVCVYVRVCTCTVTVSCSVTIIIMAVGALKFDMAIDVASYFPKKPVGAWYLLGQWRFALEMLNSSSQNEALSDTSPELTVS